MRAAVNVAADHCEAHPSRDRRYQASTICFPGESRALVSNHDQNHELRVSLVAAAFDAELAVIAAAGGGPAFSDAPGEQNSPDAASDGGGEGPPVQQPPLPAADHQLNVA